MKTHYNSFLRKNCCIMIIISKILDDEIQQRYLHNLTQEIIQEKNLNAKQTKAFKLFVHSYQTDTQIIAYVGGEGGTGKSRIISAIRLYFEKVQKLQELEIIAYTGTAASNVQGKTLHSSLKIGINNNSQRHNNIEQMRYWISKKFIIVDEVSMMGAPHLDLLQQRLSTVFHPKRELFGGLSIMFFGDFWQHPPVGARPIYQSVNWQLTHSILLDQQMRQAGDEEYIDFLRAVRDRQVTQKHLDYINERYYKDAGINLQNDEWLQAPYISTMHSIIQPINRIKTTNFATSTNNPIFVIPAFDNRDGHRACDHETREKIMEKYSSINPQKYPKVLYLSKGSKICLLSNISTPLGLTNGCTGTVVDVIITDNVTTLPDSNLVVCHKPPIILFQPKASP
jgi:hypothetical protein